MEVEAARLIGAGLAVIGVVGSGIKIIHFVREVLAYFC